MCFNVVVLFCLFVVVVFLFCFFCFLFVFFLLFFCVFFIFLLLLFFFGKLRQTNFRHWCVEKEKLFFVS